MAVAKNWHGTLNFNEWMNLAKFLHANAYSRKLKVTLIVIGWAWQIWVCPFRSQDYNLLHLKNE